MFVTGAAASDLPRLLIPAAETPAAAVVSGQPRFPSRTRQFRLNPDFAAHQKDWLSPGARLQLDLVEHQEVTLEVDTVAVATDGGLEISGHTTGDLDSSAFLVIHGNHFSGLAHFTGLGQFQWVPSAPGEVELTRLSNCGPGFCATPNPPTSVQTVDTRNSGALHAPVNGVWDPTTEPTVIDILLLYSNTALAAEGNEESLRARIYKTVENTNFRFTNSLVGVRLNPVFVGSFPWAESGSIQRDWETFQFDPRILGLRNNYKADLVYMFVESENVGYGGIASLPPAAGNPDWAFSVQTRTMLFGRPRDTVTRDSDAFAHETGHMFGAQHDFRNSFDANGNSFNGAFEYSHGFRFEAQGITYTTIMAYEPGIPVPYFSNPNLTFAGVPLGSTTFDPVPTDNAQTINRLAPIVANYRTALSRIGFVRRRFDVGEGDGKVTLELLREGNLNSATRVIVSFESTSSAKQDLDFTRPSQLTIAFATNQSSAEFTIPILQDELLEGDERIRLTLGSVQGAHGLSLNGTAEVILHDDESTVVVNPSEIHLTENGLEVEVAFDFAGPLQAGESRSFDIGFGGEGDTATPDVDVVVDRRQVTFTSEARRQVVHVRSVPDSLSETDESLQLRVGTATATVLVLDDDRVGSLLPIAAPDDSVSAIAATASGHVVVGGDFTDLQGISRRALAQLNSNGDVDASFVPPQLRSSSVEMRGLLPARVNVLRQDREGRWLVGGYIGAVDGQPTASLIRLLADGRLDTSFRNPGFDGTVWGILEQPDGRILVSGTFEKVGSHAIRGLVRLNADGSLDESFKNVPGFEGWLARVNPLVQMPDGRIYVGGIMEKYNGEVVRNLIRLLPDGSLDTSFPLTRAGAAGAVTSFAPLPDGRVYVGGFFTGIGSRPYRGLARLNADGSLDTSFRAPNPNAEVNCLQALPNGQLVVGGAFTRLAAVSRRFVALLNADGSVDSGFDAGTGAGDHVWGLAASSDGSLWLGGAFRTFNRQPASMLARLRLPAIAGAFAGVRSQTDGTLSAQIWGLPGAQYGVESSDDLVHWRRLGEVKVTSSDNRAEFKSSATRAAEYFRLVSESR